MNGRGSRVQVLIAGGGVAALEAALALRALAEDRVSVELLAPEPQFPQLWNRGMRRGGRFRVTVPFRRARR
jgi:aspartate oxidase